MTQKITIEYTLKELLQEYLKTLNDAPDWREAGTELRDKISEHLALINKNKMRINEDE